MSLKLHATVGILASRAIRETSPPCIVQMQSFLREISPPPLSLAQGIVHWQPPQEALTAAQDAIMRPEVQAYGPAAGLPTLVDALRVKLASENNMDMLDSDVMVTQGGNQAYMNVILALLDGRSDAAVLFTPYYFNHAMAITVVNDILSMTAGADALVLGPSEPSGSSLLPDVAWLEAELRSRASDKDDEGEGGGDGEAADDRSVAQKGGEGVGDMHAGGVQKGGSRSSNSGSSSPKRRKTGETPSPLINRLSNRRRPIKVVTLVNPGNPSGETLPPSLLKQFAALAQEFHFWLVVDNTYEHFAGGWYGGAEHEVVTGKNVVNVFSFSKAFGMMGWRVGYHVHPKSLTPELAKVQDTVAICPTALSQIVALAALTLPSAAAGSADAGGGGGGGGGAVGGGRAWVNSKVATLKQGHDLLRGVLERTLGARNVMGGSGALYLFARLPVPSSPSSSAGPGLALAEKAVRVGEVEAQAKAAPAGPAGAASAVSGSAVAPARVRPDGLVDDEELVERLAREFGVCIIAGSACGVPGHIRVCFANLSPESAELAEAAKRLEAGLSALLPLQGGGRP